MMNYSAQKISSLIDSMHEVFQQNVEKDKRSTSLLIQPLGEPPYLHNPLYPQHILSRLVLIDNINYICGLFLSVQMHETPSALVSIGPSCMWHLLGCDATTDSCNLNLGANLQEGPQSILSLTQRLDSVCFQNISRRLWKMLFTGQSMMRSRSLFRFQSCRVPGQQARRLKKRGKSSYQLLKAG